MILNWALPTCLDVFCGAVGAVAELVSRQHFNAVRLTALQAVHHQVPLLRPPAAKLSRATGHGHVERGHVTRRLPGDVEHAGPTV